MLKGITALICASVLLGIIPSANKYILLSGMTSGCVVFYSQLVVAVGAALLAVANKKSFKVTPLQLAMLMAVGALGMGGTGFLLNMAYDYISVGLVTMLHFLYPSLVSMAMIILFRQKLTVLKIGAILFSVFGMILIADLSGGIKFVGIIAAVCSSLTYSFYIIANEKGSINELPLLIKLFYISLGASAVFGFYSVATGGFSLPVNETISLQLFGVAGVGSLVAFYLLTAGIKLIGASCAAFFNMLEPIVSLIFSAMIYGDQMSVKAVFGCALVVSSVLLVAVDGVKNQGNAI